MSSSSRDGLTSSGSLSTHNRQKISDKIKAAVEKREPFFR